VVSAVKDSEAQLICIHYLGRKIRIPAVYGKENGQYALDSNIREPYRAFENKHIAKGFPSFQFPCLQLENSVAEKKNICRAMLQTTTRI
jgi:hypothetical protein